MREVVIGHASIIVSDKTHYLPHYLPWKIDTAELTCLEYRLSKFNEVLDFVLQHWKFVAQQGLRSHLLGVRGAGRN
jgi:hypothetical protein